MRVVTSRCDRGGSHALHAPSKTLHSAEPAQQRLNWLGACTGLNKAFGDSLVKPLYSFNAFRAFLLIPGQGFNMLC